ncbi:MAG: phenylalanine--tRNA ligase subunit beta [Halobacteriales archaeon]
MPVVSLHPNLLRKMTGVEISDEKLKEDLFNLGLEFDGEDEDGNFQLEFAPDRLDRLSTEGIARSLRYYYGQDRGIFIPSLNPPNWTISLHSPIHHSRPCVTGAIVRGIKLDDSILKSLIQLQEKLHDTIGRGRAKGSIGIHDLSMIKAIENSDGMSSISYCGTPPSEPSFVPLGLKEELTPGQILESHPTGKKYKKLVEDDQQYPAFFDDLGLFSFPPIINSARTEVTVDSRDLLIEMTGTDQWTIDRMLNIICYALEAHGATLEELTIQTPDGIVNKPDFSLDTKHLDHNRIEQILGTNFSPNDVVDLLERSGLDGKIIAPPYRGEVSPQESQYRVTIPPYRVDVLHPLDIIDDIGRTHGFYKLKPRYPDVATIGGRTTRSSLERATRQVLIGMGFEDLLNFNLINETENFSKMRLEGDINAYGYHKPVKILEPYSAEYTIIRTWVLPSLLMVLENNTHRAYPQNLLEIGFTANVDHTKDTRVEENYAIAATVAHSQASYEEAKSKLQVLCQRFNKKLETLPISHPTFIEGRSASILIDGESKGILGEIHPEVLNLHGIELPVSAFELSLNSFI